MGYRVHRRSRTSMRSGWLYTRFDTTMSSGKLVLKDRSLQIFAQERPFSQVSPILVPLLVLNGRRPPRPQNREILGLSEDVWMLAERCWDGNPSVRPRITDILSFFESASRHWVSSTSEAIRDLGLNRPTIQKPPTREQSLTVSEGV